MPSLKLLKVCLSFIIVTILGVIHFCILIGFLIEFRVYSVFFHLIIGFIVVFVKLLIFPSVILLIF